MSQLLIAESTSDAKRLSALHKQNKLQRIARGIYTDDVKSPLATIVQRHWMRIVAHIVSQGILSHRTAVTLKPFPYQGQHIVFLTSSYAKTIQLPGLLIKVQKGDTEHFIEPVLPNLSRSTTARCLLENLSESRSSLKNVKTIGVPGVELSVAKILRVRQENALNQIRDEARLIAKQLGYHTEYEKLNQIIRAILATNENKAFLQTPYAQAVAVKIPFDSARIELFERLYLYLKQCEFIRREFQYHHTAFNNLSFFESYFSNFIEGTEFLIDEAEDIVFKREEIYERHEDTHDVLAHYQLSQNYSDSSKTPNSPEELIELLCQRHAFLMSERPDKMPGQLKQKPNRAGDSVFVFPQDVIGTLQKSFPFYLMLSAGLPRALYLHFVICEVHPFSDGNGRLSRIMMNSELVSVDACKIIIPIVHRDNYLNGLRRATRDQYFTTYCKVMDQAQAYTASIEWSDYANARQTLESDCADKTADNGLPIFNRALNRLKLSNYA